MEAKCDMQLTTEETEEIKAYWYNNTPIVTHLKKANKFLLTTDKDKTEEKRQLINSVLKDYNAMININWEIIHNNKKEDFCDGMLI